MRYYAERNNLLNEDFQISFYDLREYFFQTYQYFYHRKLFDVAFRGVWELGWNNEETNNQLHSPTMSPSPEIFFLNHLNSDKKKSVFVKLKMSRQRN